MYSVVLFIRDSRLILYSTGAGVNKVQVALSGSVCILYSLGERIPTS